jgi:hypothetical protein
MRRLSIEDQHERQRECDYDAEVEAIDQERMRAHEAGECEGAPECWSCVDEQERGDESLGG